MDKIKTDVAKMPNKMDERARNCRMPRAIERERNQIVHYPVHATSLINPYAVQVQAN